MAGREFVSIMQSIAFKESNGDMKNRPVTDPTVVHGQARCIGTGKADFKKARCDRRKLSKLSRIARLDNCPNGNCRNFTTRRVASIIPLKFILSFMH
jgi:hypothetical protein